MLQNSIWSVHLWNSRMNICFSDSSCRCLKEIVFSCFNIYRKRLKSETKSGHGRSIARPISDLINACFQGCHRPCTNDRIGASKKRLCLEEPGYWIFVYFSCESFSGLDCGQCDLYNSHKFSYIQSLSFVTSRVIITHVIHYASSLLASCLFHIAGRFLMKLLFATPWISGLLSAVYWRSLAKRLYAPVLNRTLTNVYILRLLRDRECIRTRALSEMYGVLVLVNHFLIEILNLRRV